MIFVFYDLPDAKVNINNIREILKEGENHVRIVFTNGDCQRYQAFNADYHIKRITEGHIQQLIPCIAPLYNIYEEPDDDCEIIFFSWERVNFLALCANGSVRSLTSCNGYFEFADEMSDYYGCFVKDALFEFPKKNN